jgi:hypothetical protein
MSLMSLKHNFNILKRPGGLLARHIDARNPHNIVQVSHTIKDIINIAKFLRFRFLWVDTLRIVQDDEVHQETQLQRMGAIYCGAELTIVVAQGSGSQHGIHFVSFLDKMGHTIPDEALPTEILIPQSKLSWYYNPKQVLEQSKWSKRGWTMQELLFFKTTALLYGLRLFFWECHCILRDRKSKQELITASPICTKIPMPSHWTAWPDLDLYAGVVLDYNRRRLTYDADVLRAFSGITKIPEKVFPGGVHFGVPILFFDWALL